MLSRVAEHLYWLGRYTERVENTVRIVDVNTNLLLDLPRSIAPGWAPLIAITGSQAQFDDLYKAPTERNVVRFLLLDTRHSSSMLSSVVAARENARIIRDYLPREAYWALNELNRFIKESRSAGLSKRERSNYLKRIVREIHGLNGLLMGAMNHDHGYRFLEIGRLLERADMTSRIVDVRSRSLLPNADERDAVYENLQWMSVLKSLTAHQMYRRKVNLRVQRAHALEFLLGDEEFPRTVKFCMNKIAQRADELPRGEMLKQRCVNVCHMLDEAAYDTLAFDSDALNTFIDNLQQVFIQVHNSVRTTYFLGSEESDGRHQEAA
ncbi:MAG: alpha-E domain-containing protein [Gammaproteobacteria bacterium]|nr:alpha-E domain-containing protein [Gammaproteobacteria bacterium]